MFLTRWRRHFRARVLSDARAGTRRGAPFLTQCGRTRRRVPRARKRSQCTRDDDSLLSRPARSGQDEVSSRARARDLPQQPSRAERGHTTAPGRPSPRVGALPGTRKPEDDPRAANRSRSRRGGTGIPTTGRARSQQATAQVARGRSEVSDITHLPFNISPGRSGGPNTLRSHAALSSGEECTRSAQPRSLEPIH